jgi:cellulose synthase/poly-beta-1,6-N-acetylglucosamine synthase-like glycosyltransferase
MLRIKDLEFNSFLGEKMFQIVEYVFYVSFIVFAGFYAIYYLICYFYKSRPKARISASLHEDTEMPKVSFIVPVFNENRILGKKIQNLQQLAYPKDRLEIIFVDGGSTDGSIETIKNAIGQVNLDIKLVEQGRRLGFNKAVIDGFYKSSGDVILIPGAETMYAPYTLQQMVQPFSDYRIGGVNGRQIIENLDAGLSPKLEHAYRNAQDFLKEAEDNMDTLFDVKGEIVACRRKICEELVNNCEFRNKGCIDACFFFQARKDGYFTVYKPNAVYYELSPRSFKASFKQRFRRAATLIQNMLIFKDMIFNREYGLFGMLIMPAHFLMLLILPYLFLSGLVSFLMLQVIYFPNLGYLFALAVGALLLFFSETFQTFCQLQLVLITSHVEMLKGVETQRFDKLESARPL